MNVISFLVLIVGKISGISVAAFPSAEIFMTKKQRVQNAKFLGNYLNTIFLITIFN